MQVNSELVVVEGEDVRSLQPVASHHERVHLSGERSRDAVSCRPLGSSTEEQTHQQVVDLELVQLRPIHHCPSQLGLILVERQARSETRMVPARSEAMLHDSDDEGPNNEESEVGRVEGGGSAARFGRHG